MRLLMAHGAGEVGMAQRKLVHHHGKHDREESSLIY